jgi:hypothetical protein
MAPVVHGLEAEYHDQIKFSFLDIDDPANDEIKRTLGFRVQPHFFLIDENGNIIQQWVGSVSAEEFRTAFDANLQN